MILPKMLLLNEMANVEVTEKAWKSSILGKLLPLN